MATVFICDGCGQPCGTEAHHLGLALVRDYCDTCVVVAQGYLDDLKAAHEIAVSEYHNRRQMARNSIGKDGFKLPDEE